ncbi:tetratricopeptide repeat protein [Aromatoleum diolicum]|uniref:Tetratricopeptide repeat protein n=1 Tax=Aromatoleum diolicum TaxID=75796 RepID=A0ABX1QFQ9_9RHOO|nr:tetratricopeptide repeat protein [Aromatoleum diolicum]NMG77272.1 tetratricopeptide repeat protein [Aromatoleum diolicum]
MFAFAPSLGEQYVRNQPRVTIVQPIHSVTSHSFPSNAPWTPVAAALLLTVAVLLAYQGIEMNGFHFDDWHNILLNPAIHMDDFSLGGLLDAARGASLPHRPVASVTFAFDWWRGGDKPAPFLVTNLTLHVLASWAVLALLLSALRAANASWSRTRVLLAATAAAGWWAVQPIHVQAVSYIVQRMTELAALFSVLCVWAYLRARLAQGAKIWLFGGVSVCSFALAALSKQNAFITPGLIVLAEFLVLRNNAPLIQRPRDRWLLGLVAIILFAGAVTLAVGGPATDWIFRGYEWRDFTLAERLLTQPKVVAFHVSQLLWPMPGRFSLEHDIATVRSLASAEFWLPLAAILAWSAGGLWLAARRGTRLTGFFMLWVPATLAIESSFIPLEMVFEHRMYLPSMGFAGLIAIGVAHSVRWPLTRAAPAWALLACAIVFGIWSTRQRIPEWRTEISLYESAVRHAPNSVRAWNQLGLEYLQANRHEQALQAINRANEIEPRWGDGYPFLNRGVVFEATGQSERARAVYEETIRLFPKQVLGYNNLGLLYLRAGQLDQALQLFDRAVTVDPEYAGAWTNRGTANFQRGDIGHALSDFEKAISLSPRESIAFHYLARIYSANGRAADAARARTHACRLGVAADC